MDKQEFQDLFSRLEQKVSTESNRTNRYWMVRANGGYYYDTFRDENFVALITKERYLQIVDNVAQFRYEETRCRKKFSNRYMGLRITSVEKPYWLVIFSEWLSLCMKGILF